MRRSSTTELDSPATVMFVDGVLCVFLSLTISAAQTFVTNTCAHQSSAKGKGIIKASVGLESNF